MQKERENTPATVTDALLYQPTKLDKQSILYFETLLDHLKLCSEQMYYYKEKYEKLKAEFGEPKQGIVRSLFNSQNVV
jgi:predicted transposase YdaD